MEPRGLNFGALGMISGASGAHFGGLGCDFWMPGARFLRFEAKSEIFRKCYEFLMFFITFTPWRAPCLRLGAQIWSLGVDFWSFRGEC